MNNIFKNAYFGKAYKTKGDKKAIYTITSCDSHWLAVQDTSFTWEYNDNGELVSGIDNAMNIVSEWPEKIDEESLDRKANEYVGNNGGCEHYDDGVEAYKAGYREAENDIYEKL